MASVSANATNTVNEFLSAFERDDNTMLARLLTDDMTLSGPVPQPINKEQFLAMDRALTVAFPDWSFHARDLRQQGDEVIATIQITGTHTGPLAAIPNMPPIAPTGKQVRLPEEHLTFTVRGGQIAAIVTDAVPGAGVPGLYAQVGHPIA